MENYVVVVGIDKVQKFLYESLSSHRQESQSNSGTLGDVMTASKFITKDIPSDIKEHFPSIKEEDFLLKCSGKWVFALEQTQDGEQEILTELDQLFDKYYKRFQGQLILKYDCFQQDVSTDSEKLTAIKMASTKLKSSKCLSKVLAREKNREFLFNFAQGPIGESTSNKENSSEGQENEYCHFAETINQLFPDGEPNGIQQNENHFRIAVIKADLDGMGELFQNIKSYELYQKVSKLLVEWISLDKLNKLATDIHCLQEKKSADFKIYPLYIAGDDIFFAVPVHQLLQGIQLCTKLLKGLNNEIQSIYESDLAQKSNPEEIPYLSLSIGVELTFNREPIRYYYERVNHQLDDCSKTASLNTSGFGREIQHVKISINETVFFQILEGDENEKIWDKNKNLRNWNSFLSDVGNINAAIVTMKEQTNVKDDYQAHHFYYSLLEKIKDPKIVDNELAYSNTVLYHLLPETWSGNNKKLQQTEFMLLEPLIRQLFIEKEKTDYQKELEKKGKTVRVKQELSFAKSEREKLEKYLHLLVLFSDPRFLLKDSFERDLNAKEVSVDGKRILVNKTLDYLYLKALKSGKLREIFIRSEKYSPEGHLEKSDPTVYRTLEIKNAMFHRIKKVMKDSDEKVCQMIAAANPDLPEDVKDKEQQNKEEGKAPPRLYFDEDSLRQAMKDSESWNSDYVDALLIFYQYRERAIQFQTNIKTKKSNPKAKAKKAGTGSNKGGNNSKEDLTVGLSQLQAKWPGRKEIISKTEKEKKR